MSVSQTALIALCIIGAVYLFLKCGRALGGILLILCLVLAGVFALVHSFQAFSGQTLVATVQASPVANNVKLFFPIVRSAYSSAVIDPPGSYNVYVDSAGDLSATRGG